MYARRIGRFELVRHLATGGMADVYLARSLGFSGFERQLVIKILRTTDDAQVAMFLDEARILGRIHHRHVVQAYEVGCTPDGTYYLVMEFVDGETIRHVLQRAVQRDVLVPLDFALTVASSVAAGLHHAHQLGTIHRDISPSNVLAGADGSVKLIDFGIAKSADRISRTAVGFLKGKAGYMAPEQACGYPVDLRTDIYALGILAYELTTRRRAFAGNTHEEQLEQLARRAITLPSYLIDGYPRDLEHVVMTALEYDPDDRFQDARTLQLALEAIAKDLDIVLGPSCVERVLVDLFGHQVAPEMYDTLSYSTIDLDLDDLLSSATPTPIFSPH
jgi:eukaryotic-like serine/threonine-protein kinase